MSVSATMVDNQPPLVLYYPLVLLSVVRISDCVSQVKEMETIITNKPLVVASVLVKQFYHKSKNKENIVFTYGTGVI